MKKLTIILTAVILFAASAFAYRIDEIPAKVKTALEKDFVNASNITWEKGDNLYFANFNWNSSEIKAAFSADGELLSTSRKLTAAQLPLKISLAVAKKYKGYTIGDNAVEIISDDEATYQFSISDGNKTKLVTSNSNGDIVEKK